jgi:hypothetical protein
MESKTNDVDEGLLAALTKLGQELEEPIREYRKNAIAEWDKLSKDQQMMFFFAVVDRIYKGEIEEGRSYRGILYDMFEFGPESYCMGMECGFLTLHNYIIDGKNLNDK